MNYLALDELLMNYFQRTADTHNRSRMRPRSRSDRDYVSTEPQRYTGRSRTRYGRAGHWFSGVANSSIIHQWFVNADELLSSLMNYWTFDELFATRLWHPETAAEVPTIMVDTARDLPCPPARK